jgi:hypothetical protein
MSFKVYAFEQALRDEGLVEKDARAIAKATEKNVIEETLTRDFFERRLQSELNILRYDVLRWVVILATAGTLAILAMLQRIAA